MFDLYIEALSHCCFRVSLHCFSKHRHLSLSLFLAKQTVRQRSSTAGEALIPTSLGRRHCGVPCPSPMTRSGWGAFYCSDAGWYLGSLNVPVASQLPVTHPVRCLQGSNQMCHSPTTQT